MKVEIHCHTDRHSPCSRVSPSELVRMAEACGYDALFVTDHGRVWSPRELAEMRELCEQLRVLPGIEITVPNGSDILVLGADDPVYETLRAPSEIFAQACADGYLTIIAHPFRWRSDLEEYNALADAIEIQTCNHSAPEHVEAAQRYAVAHNMASVFASDAHGLNFLNKFWLETEEPFETARQFRRIIVGGHYENRMHPGPMILPPPYKASCMAELSDEDLPASAISVPNLI